MDKRRLGIYCNFNCSNNPNSIHFFGGIKMKDIEKIAIVIIILVLGYIFGKSIGWW